MFSTTQKIGILGGGQLGKMLCLAAAEWDFKTCILDASASFPAGAVCSEFTEGDFNNYEDVMAFGADKDLITIEIEHVNTQALHDLEKAGKTVHPSPAVLNIIKDKGLQKQFYAHHGLPTSRFEVFENEKELAARLGGKPIKPKIVSLKIMDTTAYDRACLFQYMIGNTDWSIRVRHNVKVIYFSGRNKAAPIPYDFDYCGLVGTNYAAPSPEIPIQTVKERYFMGPCRSAAHYQQVFDLFLSKKQAMLDHIEQSDFLAKDSKKQMDNYLDEFFQVIEKPATAKREIIQNCNKSN